MGKMQRDKGARVEREIVKLLCEEGIDAERVPLSGACGGSYSGDVRIGERKAEVKSRKNGAGFSVLEGWLEGSDFLILKRNNRKPFVAMDWKMFVKILQSERFGKPLE